MTSNNIAFAWVNLFDNATVTTSTAAANLPATNLQQEDVARKWRGTGGTTDSITATWPADQTADTFALMGVGNKDLAITAAERFLATGTVRLQLTTNGGSLGDVYDSTVTAGVVDPLYGYAIHLLTSKTFRSAKWTLAQAGASYIEAGREFVGVRSHFDYNCALGPQRTVVDPSTKKKTDGGQTKIRIRPSYRTQSFNMEWVTQAQAWSVIEAMDLANGAHKDVLMLFDPTSSNLGRDSIWGLVDKIDPVIIPGGFDSASGMLRSRQYLIEERL